MQEVFIIKEDMFTAVHHGQALRTTVTGIHRRQRQGHVRQMLAESRSADLPLDHADLSSVPGLVDALNALTAGIDGGVAVEARDEFDLKRYEDHIQAHIQGFPICLREIPPLGENLRKDLIWRFIAVVFMAHSGHIDAWQNGGMIMVMKHETDRKGQGIPGGLKGVDGIERSLGGIEA